MTAKTLVLVTCEKTGCITPSSHKLNQDGYFRRKIGGKLIMYHRHVYQEVNGLIPEGFEIDHKCRNRACCNLDHLQLLSGKDHAVKTNSERYAGRKADAFIYWSVTKCTGTLLGGLFCVTFSTACGWIREWKV